MPLVTYTTGEEEWVNDWELRSTETPKCQNEEKEKESNENGKSDNRQRD